MEGSSPPLCPPIRGRPRRRWGTMTTIGPHIGDRYSRHKAPLGHGHHAILAKTARLDQGKLFSQKDLPLRSRPGWGNLTWLNNGGRWPVTFGRGDRSVKVWSLEGSRSQGGCTGMTKSELIQRLAERNPHLYQRDVEKIVTTIFDEITEALARGDRVELRGFGAFSVKRRDARTGRNPRTGESVDVDEKVIPFFKTGKQLRERLNTDE